MHLPPRHSMAGGDDVVWVASRRLWFPALLLAAAALGATALALVAVVAVHDGQQRRALARGPVVAADPGDAVALWQGVGDDVAATPHDVIVIEPLVASAPPPPGLPRWPAPGEVYLSPTLARAGAGEQIGSRYGTLAGLIGGQGLVSASERLAYVRPARTPEGSERESWLPVAGFGAPVAFGAATDPAPLSELVLGVVAALGVPALILLWTAARRVPAARRTVGAAAPVLLGTLLAAVPLVVALFRPVTVPVTGYVVAPGDLRAAWPWMPAALVVSSLVAFGALAVVPASRGGARPVATVSQWRLTACGAAVLAVAFSPEVPDHLRLVVFGAATVVLLATLPAAVAQVVGRVVGGVWPGVWARIVTTVAVAVALVLLPPAWAAQVGGPARLAEAIRVHSGDRVLVVDSMLLSRERVDAFARALPADAGLLRLDRDGRSGRLRLTGTCAALRHLRAPCSTDAVPLPAGAAPGDSLRAWYGDRTEVAVGTLDGPGAQPVSLVVLPPAGGAGEVKRVAYATLLFAQVGPPGNTWLLGARTARTLSGWLLLAGSAALVLLMAAAALGAAPVAAPVRARSLVLVTTAAVACGVALALWHAQFFTAVADGSAVRWWHAVPAGAACWTVAVAAILAVRRGDSPRRTEHVADPPPDRVPEAAPEDRGHPKAS